MRIAAAKVGAFVARPDPAARVLLIYGPDAGLVRERADILARSVVEDPKDPFRIAHISDKELADDPARLADEAAAIAFGGGRRVVRVAPVRDAHAATVKSFLDHPVGDALIVLEAESLNSRSSLRRAVESAANAAALPCYADEGRQLGQVIQETLARDGLSADREATAFLMANLGGDRQVTRQELEKLALYAAPADGAGRGPITLAEAAACIGDTAALTLNDLSAAVADGDRARVERCYRRALDEGVTPVAVLRALARHVQTLMAFGAQVAAGKRPEDAGRALRPPVYGRNVDTLFRQEKLIKNNKLTRMLAILDEAEIRCKSTGIPDAAMCGEALSRLATLAGASDGARSRR
jgi:DNA polymerase-3 subunit delta